MKNQLNGLFLLVPLIALTGCGTPGFPRPSYSEKRVIKQLETQFPSSLIDKYYETNNTEAVRREIRNKLTDGRLTLINLNYNQFVARFSVRKQSIDAGTDIAELGVNLATTAVGGAGTKTILGAISSGVTGSKLAVDKNFFYEKTVPVLVTSMNAERKRALAPILLGLKKGTDDYPLSQALSDLDAYYFAGTFIGALQAMQADAGAKDEQAQKNLNSIRFEEDSAAKLIRLWLFPSGPESPDATHVTALKAWFPKQDLEPKQPKIERFLEDPKYKNQRQKAVTDLVDPSLKNKDE